MFGGSCFPDFLLVLNSHLLCKPFQMLSAVRRWRRNALGVFSLLCFLDVEGYVSCLLNGVSDYNENDQSRGVLNFMWSDFAYFLAWLLLWFEYLTPRVCFPVWISWIENNSQIFRPALWFGCVNFRLLLNSRASVVYCRTPFPSYSREL